MCVYANHDVTWGGISGRLDLEMVWDGEDTDGEKEWWPDSKRASSTSTF